jgi:drug/metabolite transporter (DMT)-like permease
MILVIALAVVAGLLFARAAMLQHQGIGIAFHGADSKDAVHIARNFTQLLGQPVWLLGWVTNLAGFLCQAVALHLGSVAIVQPMLTTQLLFTLLLVSWHRRTMPGRRAWLGVAGICAGLALLLGVEGAPLSGVPDRTEVLGASLAAAVSVTVLVMVSRAMRRGALVSAVAGGLCFAMSAVYMKLTADDLLTVGVAGTARDWPGYFLAASTVSGLLLAQAALAGEWLTWSVAAMNITNPVASYLAGVLAFDVALPTDPGSLAGIAGAGLLLVVGVLSLAQAPTRVTGARPAVSPVRAENRS